MRYIPHTQADVQEMLKVCGVKTVDDLFSGIPATLRLSHPLNVPQALSEPEVLRLASQRAEENQPHPQNRSFLGGGVYRHYIPQVVSDLIRRSEFLTPYTPYQPEVSQGTLQVIFEFQTMISEIFVMEVANASNYDGSTSLAEAVLMALRLGKNRKKILLPANLHPEYRKVVDTLLQGVPCEKITIPYTEQGAIDRNALKDYLDSNLAACVVAYPNFFGGVEDISDIVEKVHKAGGIVITCTTEPLALGLFTSPGEMGVDIACGEGQSFGISPNFGGPHVGLFTTRKEFLRQMPGRLCGITEDTEGRRGFVLTLSTREQHIRRARATSNICTNQALCATQATMYLSLLGKEGFQRLSRINWNRAEYLKQGLSPLSEKTFPFVQTTFNEFVVRCKRPATETVEQMQKRGWLAGIPLSRWIPERTHDLLVNITEQNSKEDIDQFAEDLKQI